MKKRYSTRLSFGYDDNGDRIRKYFYYDSKADLNRQVEEYKKQLRVASGTGRVTFKEYADRWLDTYKANRQPSTYNMYRHYINMAKPIHTAPMYAVTVTDCQEIINEHRANPRSCELLSLTLKSIFNKAIEEDKIDKNPALHLELPKYRVKEKRPLLDTEIEAIKRADMNADERLFINLLYTYGLRPAEALALTFEDFTTESLTVNKALGFDRHTSYIKETKTGDTRILPMTDSVYQDYRKYCEISQYKEGLVFRDKFGEKKSKTSAEKFKRKVLDKIMTAQGYDSHLTMYIFRHNRITELIYDGVLTGKTTVKMVSRLMGNSEKMVMEVYSHLKEDKENIKGLYDGASL